MRERMRAAARRARNVLVGRESVPAAGPPVFLTTPACPSPPGWTTDELRLVMESFAIDGMKPGELKPYVDEAFGRFLYTWDCVRSLTGPALELGANPYLMTFLLERFTELDMTLAGFYGDDRKKLVQEVQWVDPDKATHIDVRTSDLFNMEAERFPYADSTFAVVLFCEIIEHLVMDPLHALREISRVLRPDGRLVISTPNVARLENVFLLIDGVNIYDPYSGYGPYGRHNREYTMHDLVHLLRFAGFEVERQFTADSNAGDDPRDLPKYASVAPLLEFRSPDLGQYLFVIARRTQSPRDGLPTALYRSYPAEMLVEGW